MTQRSITIVGAGQSGLQLGLGLLQHGYAVRLISDRTPEEIGAGRVASSQCVFPTALSYEREVGVDLWDDAPWVEGIGLTVPHPEAPGEKLFGWAGRLDRPAQSIDQRVKFPALIELFASRGGEVVYEQAGIDDLERYTQESELVIVAAGKGDIARLFERDAERSTFDAPQRALALTYVHGLTPTEDFSRVSFNLVPGVGEYFVFPALTLSGPCDIMVFEGIPGGPLDRWAGLTPEQHLDASLDFLREYLPWEAERAADVALTDDLGVLQGRFAPTVRHPVAVLPSGRSVLGIGDVVVLNDPITGQGSNNASKSAHIYLQAILEHGDLPFDRAFGQAAFERYWARVKPVADWTNALLLPPPPHVLQVLGAAAQHQEIATRFANGFDDPADYGEYFLDPAGAERYLADVAARAS
ncbi:styrene monooxygenase/indole monooxygenase family protein [Streptomyces sp. AC495_CC817]|uniref:styrene monooxygenase/indole monooxygenase family protein n=1 Tax=Streptomyces sp. AC495_CC817 TaxID=2823900 RepID=UPI001C27AE36|nr:styrene monooxygenase/indole monooxygenase family protein [Streptomyces sp. AC495_CC817]